MGVRAIKGATTVDEDGARAICAATAELLQAICAFNGISPGHAISVLLTATTDLRSEFPARGARDAGWGDVPMLCATEIDVPGALPRCIRVLVHAELSPEHVVRHVYLHEAKGLRPDLLGPGDLGATS